MPNALELRTVFKRNPLDKGFWSIKVHRLIFKNRQFYVEYWGAAISNECLEGTLTLVAGIIVFLIGFMTYAVEAHTDPCRLRLLNC